MLDSMGMSFPSPFTPAPKTQSTALTVRQEPQSLLDFTLGGTPKQTPKKSEYDLQQDAKRGKLTELIGEKRTTKETLQYNNLREELANVPNPNPTIASNAIKNAIKGKLARMK